MALKGMHLLETLGPGDRVHIRGKRRRGVVRATVSDARYMVVVVQFDGEDFTRCYRPKDLVVVARRSEA